MGSKFVFESGRGARFLLRFGAKGLRPEYGLGLLAALAVVGCMETTTSGGGSDAMGDAARTGDAATPGPDASGMPDARTTTPDARLVAPDARALVPDARVLLPDAAVAPLPDAAVAPLPDAAVAPLPDAAVAPLPDVAVAPTPDAAVAPAPDAAVAPTPDAAVAPTPDAAVAPVPDAAVVDPAAPLPDLMLIEQRTADDLYFEERIFDADSCAIVEGCVGGPGLRRLLRFGVSTANVGNVDFLMGDPRENQDLFQFSPCHGHFHFNGYADYALVDAAGRVAAPGHKQAFCLLDSGRYLDDPDVRQFPRYQCDFQGISRGWYDSYGSGLDCQWIDVTDVPPGDYDLQVRVNPDRNVRELDYTNNDLSLRVTVPSFDMSAPCGPNDAAGPDRNCDWRVGFTGQCDAGELVDAGCQQAGPDCAQAVCPDQPFMRICGGIAQSCLPRTQLAASQNDCGTCPQTSFRCPAEGAYTVWVAAPDPGLDASCDVAVTRRPEPPIDAPCAEGQATDGIDRSCGWVPALDGPVACMPGVRYVAGCTGGAMGCGGGEVCVGDPVLLVCPGDGACTQPQRIGAADDACGGLCPAAAFTCPVEGQVSVYTASFRAAEATACRAGIVQQN
jgi:hypothetical protein